MIRCACGCGRFLEKYDKYGRVRKFLVGHHKSFLNIEDQFWPYVKKTETCWIWQAGKTTNGYGLISRRGKRIYAHRLSYELHYGKIPPKKHVLHKCDNPSCVNPDHLFLGTPLTNTHDAIKKGRKPGGCLTNEDVAEIREMAKNGMSQHILADTFNVCRPHISKIINNKRRKI